MNTHVIPIQNLFWPPEHDVHVSFKVTLRHKHKEIDIKPHIHAIIHWYKQGCIDFPTVKDFSIVYNKLTDNFDISYKYIGDDEYISIRIADQDTEGLFPITIVGVPYRVVGHVVN